MNQRFFYLLFTALLGVMLVGCGRSAQSAASRGDKAFQSAPPEIKSAWETAKSAIKANDYTTALSTFQKLSMTQGLSPEQTQALQATATAVSDQMYDAANKGDPKAKQAIQDLRKMGGR